MSHFVTCGYPLSYHLLKIFFLRYHLLKIFFFRYHQLKIYFSRVSPIENFFLMVSLFENNFFPVSPNEKQGSHYFFWYHLLKNLWLPVSPYENFDLPISLFENVPICNIILSQRCIISHYLSVLISNLVTIKNPIHRQVMDQKRSSSNCCLIETYRMYNHTERLCQCILSIETTS